MTWRNLRLAFYGILLKRVSRIYPLGEAFGYTQTGRIMSYQSPELTTIKIESLCYE